MWWKASECSFVLLRRIQDLLDDYMSSTDECGQICILLCDCQSIMQAYAVAITSLLSGAAVVHNIMRPDLVRCMQPQLHHASKSNIHCEAADRLCPCRRYLWGSRPGMSHLMRPCESCNPRQGSSCIGGCNNDSRCHRSNQCRRAAAALPGRIPRLEIAAIATAICMCRDGRLQLQHRPSMFEPDPVSCAPSSVVQMQHNRIG